MAPDNSSNSYSIYTQGFCHSIYIHNRLCLYLRVMSYQLFNVVFLVQSTMAYRLFSDTEGSNEMEITETTYYVHKC